MSFHLAIRSKLLIHLGTKRNFFMNELLNNHSGNKQVINL